MRLFNINNQFILILITISFGVTKRSVQHNNALISRDFQF